MTLEDFKVDFKHINLRTLFKDWEWLIGNNFSPIILTALGDAFFKNTIDGTIYFLNVASHQFWKVSESSDDFEELLSNSDFIREYFNTQIIGELKQGGMLLKEDEIYSFKLTPSLGGEYAAANVEVSNIKVHYSFAGQIAFQIKDLPEGAPIGKIVLKNPPKFKWKFWQ